MKVVPDGAYWNVYSGACLVAKFNSIVRLLEYLEAVNYVEGM